MLQLVITGHIGRDAETRDAGDDKVTSFSVASTKKQKSGEVTTWVNCSVWGKRGEALREYLRKGTPVTVVGELSERTYEKDGEKRHALECRVSDVALQGGKGDATSAASKPKTTREPGDDPEWMRD